MSILGSQSSLYVSDLLCLGLFSLQWRHNGRDSASNHQPHDCLLKHLFRRRSKKTSKLRVTSHCAGNSPGTGEFPAQMASNAEMFPFDDVIMCLLYSKHWFATICIRSLTGWVSCVKNDQSIRSQVSYSCVTWSGQTIRRIMHICICVCLVIIRIGCHTYAFKCSRVPL